MFIEIQDTSDAAATWKCPIEELQTTCFEAVALRHKSARRLWRALQFMQEPGLARTTGCRAQQIFADVCCDTRGE
jgi:hypothetical protein